MLKYLFEIFCKDTKIGLCQIDADYNSDSSSYSYFRSITNKHYISEIFKDSISIDQIAYHL